MVALSRAGAPHAAPAGATAGARGRALVFIGFMAAGKSTAARAAAEALGRQTVDSDRLLEQRFGHSVAEEFALKGEPAFRASEEELVLDLLAGAGASTVIALGGGSILSERVRAALAGHVTVLLDVDPAAAWERVAAASSDAPERPLTRDRDSFVALHAERQQLYESVADAIVPSVSGDVVERALPALAQLAQAPAGTRMLWSSSASGEYPVLVGRGLLGSTVWPLDRERSRGFCVCDDVVAPIYGDRVEWAQHQVLVAAGEQHKTLVSAELVWRSWLDAGMTRGDHAIALGGGVVGDLTGFCAAAYQRGVPVVQVPTTLLAQVDSAYGGKTGVDLPGGKNYVGVYHQPAGVIVDPETLETLPDAERAAGYAEVLKTALIAGGELWERVAADGPVDDGTILACARAKLDVVARDERDAGTRQILNLGHTVGHAVEAAAGFGRYRHGEAVGLGLLAALRLSGQLELRARVCELLAGHGLPVTLTGVSAEDVVAATRADKKRVGARVPFVLLDAPGDVRPGVEVGDDELLAAVAELAEP